jgi:uncharacterized OsmC-like protein
MTTTRDDTTEIPADAPWRDIDESKLPDPVTSGITIHTRGAEGMRASLRCTTATVEGKHMLKEGKFGKHTVMSDEGPMIGGDDAYPPPIAYMALGMGFCLLTQLGRYASMKKVDFTRAECDVELDLGVTGSVLRGDVAAACHGARTVFRVESDADPAALLEVITLAKRGCFGEAMLREPVEMGSTIFVNGQQIDIEGITT